MKIFDPGTEVYYYDSNHKIVSSSITYVEVTRSSTLYSFSDINGTKKYDHEVGITPEEMIEKYYSNKIKNLKDKQDSIQISIEDLEEKKERELEDLFRERNGGTK